MVNATDVRKGIVLMHKNKLFVVVGVTHITPGNWRAIIQIKMKDIATGGTIEERFSSSDKIETAVIEQHEMEYLYADGDDLVFMNQENYEQVHVKKELLGDDVKFLRENEIVKINIHDGRAIALEIPFTVELKVTKTDPGLKGATVTNVFKPATLETGAVVNVPPFIDIGEVIRVDTRTGDYLERVNVKK
ncbi:MAG: elongation factor P [Planctomycetes bacterium RBG_16_59_8]|nr:MAG: elongation factor P [Planctomycetes bacterium RBG_16_59_8]